MLAARHHEQLARTSIHNVSDFALVILRRFAKRRIPIYLVKSQCLGVTVTCIVPEPIGLRMATPTICYS